MATLAELYRLITADTWRETHPFDEAFATAQNLILSASDFGGVTSALAEWLSKYQPCLFGRSAARLGLLSYCVITEKDILDSDQHVLEQIQNARTRWTREGFDGKKSGFVVVAISPTLAIASPSAALREFARRLCALYLLEDIDCNVIYMDEMFLEAPGRKAIWRWKAGVNFFGAQGDGRWWRDHRIPGGVGFSVNSVGHMSKSGAISKVLKTNMSLLGLTEDDLSEAPIDSLEKALVVAMQTIFGASDGVSGKATSLKAANPGEAKCPFSLPPKLAPYSCREYEGFYHTDYTIPTDYFRPDEERPKDVRAIPLDFTYLFEPGSDNTAATTMGLGVRIKGELGGSKSGRGKATPICPRGNFR